MSKKTVRFFGILFAVIAATGFVSCSDDTTSNFDPAGSIAEIFENMKGDYSGTYNTPYNVRKEVRFSIDKQAEFKISNFPMENVLYNIYKGEYVGKYCVITFIYTSSGTFSFSHFKMFFVFCIWFGSIKCLIITPFCIIPFSSNIFFCCSYILNAALRHLQSCRLKHERRRLDCLVGNQGMSASPPGSAVGST